MGFFLQYAWLIPLFPLLSFAIITLTPIRLSKSASGWLAIGLMLASTVVALGVAGDVLSSARSAGHRQVAMPRSPWATISTQLPRRCW